MLQPKRVKYRRPHIIKYEGKATTCNTVAFGEYGLQALEGTWITTRQIEAARVVISRYTKRGGKVYIRIFPHLAKTQKAAGTRMGSGKGTPEDWVAVVRKGTIMFEMGGVAEDVAREALRLSAYKLPIKCKVVGKGE